MQKIYNCLKRSFTRDADKHTSRGVASIFPWGGLKYGFQNFGKCNLGEYLVPLGMSLPGGVGTFPNYLHTYIYTLYLFIHGKNLSIYIIKNVYYTNTVLQDCRVGV